MKTIINKYATLKEVLKQEILTSKFLMNESDLYDKENDFNFLIVCESGIYEVAIGVTFYRHQCYDQKIKSFKRRNDLLFVCNEYEEYDAEFANDSNPDGLDEDYDYNDYVVIREDEKIMPASELKNEDCVMTLKNYWCKQCGSIHRCWEKVYSNIECPICGNGGAFNNTFIEVDHFETKDDENFAITVDGERHKI